MYDIATFVGIDGKPRTLSPPAGLETQSIALIARKGQGKSYTASVMVEEFLEHGVQVVVIATLGNWWGLRVGADGKSKGFDIVILGGHRGDVPLTATSGRLVADLVVSTGRSFILDVSLFSKADRIRFCLAFSERLWELKKAQKNPSVVHLMLEEAQLLVPQVVRSNVAELYGILEEIIRLGRNQGIGCTLITQRPQSVNKEVLSQTEVLFAFQIGGKKDREAIKEWIEDNDGDLNLLVELTKLQPGEAFFWSPSWMRWLGRVRVRARRTFDSTATPKAGEKRREARALAPLDLEEVKKAMAQVEVEAEANNVGALKRKVAKLEADLAAARAATPVAASPKVEYREKLVLKDRDFKQAESVVKQANTVVVGIDVKIEALKDLREKFYRAALEIGDAIDRTRSPAPASQPLVTIHKPGTPAHDILLKAHPATAPTRATDGDPGALIEGEARVLAVVAQYPNGIPRESISIMVAQKRSYRDLNIQKLKRRGFITEGPGRSILITDAGRAALPPDFAPLPTGDALREYWRGEIDEGERAVFDVICARYPDPIAREEIDSQIQYRRSYRDLIIQKLKRRMIVHDAARGSVIASSLLFNP